MRAGICIVIACIIATIGMLVLKPNQSDEFYATFGAELITALSVFRFMYVLWINEKSTPDEFGNAIRNEMGTIVMMIGVAAIYTTLKLFKILTA